jgi:hypothetical protein
MRAWTVSLIACLVLTGACKPDERREPEAKNGPRVASQRSLASEGEVIVNEAYRFSVRLPGPGWRQLDEQTSRRLNPIAAVTVADGKGGTGTVTVQAMPGATLEGVTRALWSPEAFSGQLESESELEYQGQPAKRRIYTIEVRGGEARAVHTVFVHQDHVYQVISGGAASLGLELPMRFQDSFVLLEGEVDGQRQVLVNSPEAEPPDATRQRRFEGQRSVYGGVFRDFEHAATWTVPPGSWEVLALGESEQTSRHTVLQVQERELGLNGSFEVIDGRAVEVEEVLTRLVADKIVEERGTTTGDGITLEWVRARRDGPPSTLFLFALGLREGGMVSWSLQADYETAEQHEAIAARMTAALEGTRLLPELPPMSEAEGVFTDHQYGVSLRPPPGFERRDSAADGVERQVRWSEGERELELMVMVSTKVRDPEALLDLYEAALESNGGSRLDPVEDGELELGGRKARQLRTADHRVRVDLVAFEGVIYGLTSRDLSEEELEAARANLRFLE